MDRDALLTERERLLTRYMMAKRDERRRIIARLVVIDEKLEAEEHEQRARSSRKAV